MTQSLQHTPNSQIAPALLARFTFDQCAATANGCDWVIGVDEVGRGSWVGPVVTAGMCFYPHVYTDPDVQGRLALLNDSKKLIAAHREAMAATLPLLGWTCLAAASQDEVETLNLHHASLLGLWRAVEALLPQMPVASHGLILVDGKFPLPNLEALANRFDLTLSQQAVIQGDGLSASIAAASILAKTHRDALLSLLSLDYPGYGWENNAGYGTPLHQKAIGTLGATPLHRKTFKFMQTISSH